MEVREIMSRDVRIAGIGETLSDAAAAMADEDVGALPVSDRGKLVGMITDRDIVVRAVALGRSPSETVVGDVMSEEALYCFEDEDVEEAARNMSELKIRRLPVLNRAKRLVGILALADVARHVDTPDAGEVLQDISAPGDGPG
ncbi:MAG: CBS domain-containing protein [Steroidobacteraceae bacterium]